MGAGRRRAGRAAGIAAGAGAGLAGGALAAGWYALYRRPQPRTSGRVTVRGIRAPVRLVRDRWGTVTVEATSAEDAAYAMGRVHAEERGWQMEFNRRVVAGRLGEVAGADGLGSDRFMRRLGLRRVAETEAAWLEGDTLRCLDAYAAGVTEVWRSGRPLPLEMQLLRLRPEPWTPADSLSVAKLLDFGLALNMDFELRRLELLRRLGPDAAARLDLPYAGSNPTILAETARAAGDGGDASALFHETARWVPARGGASNSWVVDGSMTASGRPLLCNDPHLPPSAPSVWFLAHVMAGDDFESVGVTLAGLPFPVVGHNRRVAWGYTNSWADVQDLVIEELDGPDARRYRTETGMAEAEVRAEVIGVKGGPDVVESVAVTRHGPLIERYRDGSSGIWRGLALQWTALTPGRSADALQALQRTRDWSSFRAALSLLDGPSQNVVYADCDGHIGYFLCGRIPVRRRPASGLPVPGWDGSALWERFLDVDEVPQVLDPDEHMVVTANNRITGAAFPHHISDDYMNGYRALRLRELLAGRSGLGAADMAAVQMDLMCPPAREVVALLRGMTFDSAAAEEARRDLCAWDGVLRADSAVACLYEAFMRRLTEHALTPLCGENWRLAVGEMPHPVFGTATSMIGGVTPHLLRRWREDDAGWFPGGQSWDEVVSHALEDAVADLRRIAGDRRHWRWGWLHHVPIDHVLARRRPLGLLFNAGTVEVGGDTDTVHQTGYLPNDPYRTRAWAPSWRQIMDPGDWTASTGIHYPGQSGHPGSPHYRDLTADWARNRQHPLPWGAQSHAASARAITELVPAPLQDAV